MNKAASTIFIPRNILEVLIIIIVGALIYSNVLNGEFISDDHVMIVDNPAVRDLGNIPAIWQAFHTRFMVGLTFALNYHWGGLDVFGYHAINIMIHVINALLVRSWANHVFATPAVLTLSRDWPVREMAFFSGLIFLVHPIQTESVSYITQRAASLGAMFYFLALIGYLKARLEQRPGYLAWSLIAMFIGLLTKEFMFTLPGAIIMHELLLFQGAKERMGQRFKRCSLYVVPALMLPAILLTDPNASRLGLKGQLLSGYFHWDYFLTLINAFVIYLRLVLIPVGQVFDYDLPIARHLFEWPTFFCAGIVGATVLYAFRQWRKDALKSFVIAMFFVTMAVESFAVCMVEKGVIYEHWLYLPMAGLSILLTTVLYGVIKDKKRWSRSMVLVIFLLCVLTFQRNFVWQNEIGFWLENLRHTPNKANVHFAVGIAYDRRELWKEAVPFYHKAIDLDPEHFLAMNNLAIAYVHLGRGDLGEAYFKRSIEVNPHYHDSRANLSHLERLRQERGR